MTAVNRALLVIAVAMLWACSPFTPQVRNRPAGDLPATFSLYGGERESSAQWWEGFEDPELTRLVETALSDNFSIHQAWARLNQARARAVQAGAARYADLTGKADGIAGRQKSGSEGWTGSGVEDLRFELVSSYEVDLWGRVRAVGAEAALRAGASREDLHAAAVSLAAAVAERWLGIASQRMQKALLEAQLKTNTTLLELVELRFRKSMVSALDVYQQRQVVENVRAEIPLVEATEEVLHHQLAVLLGKPPRTDLGISLQEFPDPRPPPSTGLPADLLAARPDVRAAGLRLQAADWQIAAARADRLPALRLTARARLGQGDLDVIFDNWLLTLAGNLTAPILDGGRRAAEVERVQAVADENLAAYRDTVLTAIREVEDALVREDRQRRHIQGLEQVVKTARQALREAGIRYRNGLNDYLPVLTQLLTVQGLERDLIRRRAELLTTRVQLHRALAGTWPDTLAPPAPEIEENVSGSSGPGEPSEFGSGNGRATAAAAHAARALDPD